MATVELVTGAGGNYPDGSDQTPIADSTGAMMVSPAGTRFAEAVLRGNVFSMMLTATSAGWGNFHIETASIAAANVQFCLYNPLTSKYNLSLLRFVYGSQSGTAGATIICHGGFKQAVAPTLAATTTIKNNLPNGRPSVATGFISAAGTVFTGNTKGATFVAPTSFANELFTVGDAPAIPRQSCLEMVDGGVVLPPGTGWVPFFMAGQSGAGWLATLSITWEEVPIPLPLDRNFTT